MRLKPWRPLVRYLFLNDRLDQLQPWSTFTPSTTFFSAGACLCLFFDHLKSIFLTSLEQTTFKSNTSSSNTITRKLGHNTSKFLNPPCTAPAGPRTLLQFLAWNVCVFLASCSGSSVCPKKLVHQQLSAHVTVATPVTSKFFLSLNKLNDVPSASARYFCHLRPQLQPLQRHEAHCYASPCSCQLRPHREHHRHASTAAPI